MVRRPRMRSTFAAGIVALVGMMLLASAWATRNEPVHVRVVNKSSFNFQDATVRFGEVEAKEGRWPPGEAIAIDVRPDPKEPLIIRFADPKGGRFSSRYVMGRMREAPGPDDTFRVSVVEIDGRPAFAQPEVLHGAGPFRGIQKLLGW